MKENSDIPRRKLILSSVGSEGLEVDVWLAALRDCRARTHKAIAGIQTDELDWMCPLSRNTIGTVLYHIAAIELDWLYNEILEQEFPDDFRTWFPYDVRDSNGNLTPVADGAREHEERLRYVRDKLVGTLSTMAPLEFHRVRHLEAYDVTPQWVVCHLLQHEAEHRGQIAIMRRCFRDFVNPP